MMKEIYHDNLNFTKFLKNNEEFRYRNIFKILSIYKNTMYIYIKYINIIIKYKYKYILFFTIY